ncbi:MAG: DUF2490 domain-containing protein [Candidatus Acidiferrum sp.]
MSNRTFLILTHEKLRQILRAFCVMLVCFSWAVPAAKAQDLQFLPEVDAYVKLDSNFRAYLQAKDDREGGDPTQFTFGPSIELYLKPLVKLEKVMAFDLDDSKSRPLVLEAGYRYITAPNAAPEDRELAAATFNFPMAVGFHISDRNRIELDWKSGSFTWRYRNRLTLERTFAIHSHHFIPYVAAEPFYESQYNKWSSTDLYVGSLFPVGKHFEFNLYYEHENDTYKEPKPNRQQNYVGLALYLYFSAPGQSRSH